MKKKFKWSTLQTLLCSDYWVMAISTALVGTFMISMFLEASRTEPSIVILGGALSTNLPAIVFMFFVAFVFLVAILRLKSFRYHSGERTFQVAADTEIEPRQEVRKLDDIEVTDVDQE